MKILLAFSLGFLWLQSCSQSPAPNSSSKSPSSILTDSSAVSLGNSPDEKFRLFKTTRQNGGQTVTELKILRLQDLSQALVSTHLPSRGDAKWASGEPKFYWSKDFKSLIADNSAADSSYEHEVVIFDLHNFSLAQRKPGKLVAFDLMNDVAFLYRTMPDRQIICFFEMKDPAREQQTEIVAPPIGKLPTAIVVPSERKIKVKAYTTGDVPVNISSKY